MELNPHEARVLGVLVEKAFTTPDHYPLTLNAITNGANQRSNRDPVVDFSEAEVTVALQGLQMKHLAGGSVPAGSRVEKWRHNAQQVLGIDDRELAVLAELLLRGPQTPGELRGRAKRMRDVPDLEVLDQVVRSLVDKGYARSVAPAPGSRSGRFAQSIAPHLHPDGSEGEERTEAVPAAPVDAPPPAHAPPAPAPTPTALGERVATLEEEVARLKRRLAALAEALGEPLPD